MKTPWIVRVLSSSFLVSASLSSAALAQCLEWKPGFGLPGGGVSSGILSQAVYDDGSGPALFVGGTIDQAGDLADVHGIARWSGTSWSKVGNGVTSGAISAVRALIVFDDGSGSALYAGGDFGQAGGVPGTSGIARWNGTTWSSVGGGLNGYVLAFAVYDDGSGPALYAAGGLSAPGVPNSTGLAKWNGSSWSNVGGNAGTPYALAVCDFGSGPKLFASGGFFSIGGVPGTQFIAQWDGTSWSALAGGMNAPPYALIAYDDGSGSALYAGGSFTLAGGTSASCVARWNGTSWSALGAGCGTASGTPTVSTFAVFDDGAGPELYAGGGLTTAGGQPASRIAKWNGASWSTLSSGANSYVLALSVFDDGGGARVYAGGDFTVAGGISCSRLASWGNGDWRALTNATKHGIAGEVFALTTFDDGSGTALFAGGNFAAAGSTIASGIAKWSGTGWSALGSGVSGVVHSLLVWDDGSGPALYVGGQFFTAGGVTAKSIARWNGTSWSALGNGLSNGGEAVSALAVFDDGTGPALYAGGFFQTSGGAQMKHIAKWTGSTWVQVGGGSPDIVESLLVYDDGSGTKLYAGGQFTQIGGIIAPHIARWNGSVWSPVGGGLGFGGSSEDVNALIAYDDGSGTALIAAGSFAYADGAPVASVAKWNGTSWSPFGSLNNAGALAIFDDGSGPGLFAGEDGNYGGGFRKWNGTQWVEVGGGMHAHYPQSHALAVFNDGTSGGPDLYIGGAFNVAGTVSSAAIAEWRGCAGPGTIYCFGDTLACPCGNRGIDGHGCDNSAATGGALLASAGHTNPDSVVLAVTHELPSALSIFLQGNATIAPVPFGDGLRCAGGSLKRLYVKHASGGVVFVPQPGDPSITTRSAELGDTIVPGSLRYYQTYYRDPSMTFCPAPTGNTWNVTNGVRIQW